MTVKGEIVSAWYKKAMRSPVIVLTGAGASVPLGMPDMCGFLGVLDKRHHVLANSVFSNATAGAFDLEHLLGKLELFIAFDEAAKQYTKTSQTLKQPDFDDLIAEVKSLREDVFNKIISTYGRLNASQTKRVTEIYKDLYAGLLCCTGEKPWV